MSQSIGKYLTVECYGETLWAVHAKRSGNVLGMIDWYAGWKCYVFQPDHATEFDAQCLRDIAAFMTALSEAMEKILAAPVDEEVTDETSTD